MRTYAVFGGRLRSELHFPDLSPATAGDVDWEFRVVSELPESGDERLLGAYPLGEYAGRLYRGAGYLRLRLEGLGDCVISADGRELLWADGGRTAPEFLRLVVLGPALALALLQAGTLCLHASAVEIAGRVVGFVAPKGTGKSSLAMALVQEGARLVTDDALALDVEPLPLARPGVHSIRLRDDTVDELAGGPVAATVVDGWKKTLVDFPREALRWEPAPLAAMYVLSPAVATPPGPRARRERLQGVRATIELAKHGKLADPLIGPAATGAQLQRIAAVVRAVPVYVLHVPRDLRTISEVARRLLGWHGARSRARSLAVAADVAP